MNLNQDLYARLSSIGINISCSDVRYEFTDIEKTICLAAKAIDDDQRILGLILSWIKVHGVRVNIERLKKISSKEKNQWLFLLASYAKFCGQNRWKFLFQNPVSEIANGDLELARLRIQRKGEEIWAKGTGFLISRDSEPIDDKYVLSPTQLSKVNMHYKNKLLYGANWRADIVTAFQAGAQNAFQATKMSFSSYEPAHRIFIDFKTAGIF